MPSFAEIAKYYQDIMAKGQKNLKKQKKVMGIKDIVGQAQKELMERRHNVAPVYPETRKGLLYPALEELKRLNDKYQDQRFSRPQAELIKEANDKDQDEHLQVDLRNKIPSILNKIHNLSAIPHIKGIVEKDDIHYNIPPIDKKLFQYANPNQHNKYTENKFLKKTRDIERRLEDQHNYVLQFLKNNSHAFRHKDQESYQDTIRFLNNMSDLKSKRQEMKKNLALQNQGREEKYNQKAIDMMNADYQADLLSKEHGVNVLKENTNRLENFLQEMKSRNYDVTTIKDLPAAERMKQEIEHDLNTLKSYPYRPFYGEEKPQYGDVSPKVNLYEITTDDPQKESIKRFKDLQKETWEKIKKQQEKFPEEVKFEVKKEIEENKGIYEKKFKRSLAKALQDLKMKYVGRGGGAKGDRYEREKETVIEDHYSKFQAHMQDLMVKATKDAFLNFYEDKKASIGLSNLYGNLHHDQKVSDYSKKGLGAMVYDVEKQKQQEEERQALLQHILLQKQKHPELRAEAFGKMLGIPESYYNAVTKNFEEGLENPEEIPKLSVMERQKREGTIPSSSLAARNELNEKEKNRLQKEIDLLKIKLNDRSLSLVTQDELKEKIKKLEEKLQRLRA